MLSVGYCDHGDGSNTFMGNAAVITNPNLLIARFEVIVVLWAKYPN